MIYAFDFDGTIVENKFPDIGKPINETVEFIKNVKKDGNYIILNTMRENEYLDKAVDFCKSLGIEFDSINDNLEHMKDKYKNNPRKIYADYYIDDNNLFLDYVNKNKTCKNQNKEYDIDCDFIENNINTIINDDCFNVLNKIPNNSIDCIYVDVPYLIDNHGYGNSELAKRMAKRDFNLYDIGEEKYNNNLTISENMKKFNKRGKVQENVRIFNNINNSAKDRIDITKGFDYKTFIEQAFRIMKKPNMFIWCSKNQIRDIMNEVKKYIKSDPDILVWCKTNPVPSGNNHWLSDVEYCLYIKEGG